MSDGARVQRSYLIGLEDGTEEWVTIEHAPNPSIADLCTIIGRGMGITFLGDRAAHYVTISADEASTPIDLTR